MEFLLHLPRMTGLYRSMERRVRVAAVASVVVAGRVEGPTIVVPEERIESLARMVNRD
jgi:hypothetical protein